MIIQNKGNCFKGNQKNRNKKVSAEDRRIIYTKKKSKKEYDVKIIAREGIGKYLGKEVEVNGELVFIDKKNPLAAALLENVYIEDNYIDHVWINFDILDRKKLKYCYKRCRIFCTAVVTEYVKRNDRQIGVKYGLTKVKLRYV